MKVTVMRRWPLYKGDRYDRFDCTNKYEKPQLSLKNILNLHYISMTNTSIDQNNSTLFYLIH